MFKEGAEEVVGRRRGGRRRQWGAHFEKKNPIIKKLHKNLGNRGTPRSNAQPNFSINKKLSNPTLLRDLD